MPLYIYIYVYVYMHKYMHIHFFGKCDVQKVPEFGSFGFCGSWGGFGFPGYWDESSGRIGSKVRGMGHEFGPVPSLFMWAEPILRAPF